MLVLALDTATAATSVRVVEFGAASPVVVRASRSAVDPRAHGEQLTPLIRAALAEAGVRTTDLAAIVAGTGPGPFTGLRVGLVTAAAMGQALDLPTYGVCSLDGIGAAIDPAPALVATDARRREVYWAIYADGQRLTDPAVDRPGDLPPALPDYGVKRGYGEGALRYRDVLALPVAETALYPDPTALAMLAVDRIGSGAPGEQLVPRYLRRPDTAAPRPPKPATPR